MTLYADKTFDFNLKTTNLFIKNNKATFFFTKADKSNVTVCMNVDDYKSKIKLLVIDKNTYKIVKRNKIVQNHP